MGTSAQAVDDRRAGNLSRRRSRSAALCRRKNRRQNHLVHLSRRRLLQGTGQSLRNQVSRRQGRFLSRRGSRIGRAPGGRRRKHGATSPTPSRRPKEASYSCATRNCFVPTTRRISTGIPKTARNEPTKISSIGPSRVNRISVLPTTRRSCPKKPCRKISTASFTRSSRAKWASASARPATKSSAP